MGATTPDNLIGKSDFDFYPRELAEQYFASEQPILREGKSLLDHEEPNIDVTGRAKWDVTTKVPLRDSQGKIIGLVGVTRDISGRKQVEEALRESEEKYRTILENIQDGYYEVDLTGSLTFFNDSLCRLYGYSKDELMGMNYRQYMDKETAKVVYQTYNAVYRTGEPTTTLDWEVIRKDGARRFVQVSVSLMRGPTGEPVGFRGTIRDITGAGGGGNASRLATPDCCTSAGGVVLKLTS
jgi:PAS domain S-box-containing protein